MRGGLALLMLVAALSACKREASFDERFEAAQEHTRKTASEIQAELDARAKETAQGDVQASEAAPDVMESLPALTGA